MNKMPTNSNKGFLQRLSVIVGILSFLLALVSGVLLTIRAEAMGFNNPISASLLACSFFFVFVGTVLSIIGRSNLPSFRFEK